MFQNNALFGTYTEKNIMHEYGPEVWIASHLCIFRLLKKLDDLKKEIDTFWGRHEKRLKQALILRQFEEEFRLVGFPEFTGPYQASHGNPTGSAQQPCNSEKKFVQTSLYSTVPIRFFLSFLILLPFKSPPPPQKKTPQKTKTLSLRKNPFSTP